MKAITPKQLDLTQGMTRAELILATAPHIDPNSEAFKADMAKIEKIELAEAAKAKLNQECSFEDFDWATDPSVILQEQRATAVYRNPVNALVIRQKQSWDEDSDPFVVVTEENLVTFMEALAARARE